MTSSKYSLPSGLSNTTEITPEAMALSHSSWIKLDTIYDMPFKIEQCYYKVFKGVIDDWLSRQPNLIVDGSISHHTLNLFVEFISVPRVLSRLILDDKIRLIQD